jgi:hypothetical protein
VFISNDGGKSGYFKYGMPPACVMDLDIQRRENDLVVRLWKSFILDD